MSTNATPAEIPGQAAENHTSHGKHCGCTPRKEVDSKVIAKRVSDNLIRLLSEHPFYGVFLLNTEVYEVNHMPTAATDGVSIFYNKYFFDSLSDEELAGVLMHEVLHMIYSHCDKRRRGNKARCTWNKALDYVINLEIEQMSGRIIQLPKKLGSMGIEICLDHKYRDMYPEQVYDLLNEEQKNKKSDGKKGQKGPKDPNAQKGQGDGEGEGGESEGREGENDPDHDGHGKDCGCFDEHMDSPEDAASQREIEDRILGAAASARQYGNLPANIGKLLDDIRDSKVPWARALLRYVGSTLQKIDYSYAQFNRRFISQEMYLPSMNTPTLGTVALAIDSSGSIYSDPALLNQFGAEMKKLSNLIKEIHVMSCDTHVHTYTIIQDMANLEKACKVSGGGGTDFRPPFEELKKRRMIPELFIYLTDGEGTFPEKAPNYPVIWCLTPGATVIPPWGVVIKMKAQ